MGQLQDVIWVTHRLFKRVRVLHVPDNFTSALKLSTRDVITLCLLHVNLSMFDPYLMKHTVQVHTHIIIFDQQGSSECVSGGGSCLVNTPGLCTGLSRRKPPVTPDVGRRVQWPQFSHPQLQLPPAAPGAEKLRPEQTFISRDFTGSRNYLSWSTSVTELEL